MNNNNNNMVTSTTEGNRELNNFLENLNWNSTEEYDSIYDDELAGFVPSLDGRSSSSSNNLAYKKLSPDNNLSIARELQAQQHQALNNIAVRQMVEANQVGSNNNSQGNSNPAILTQLLGMYVAQQNNGSRTKQNAQDGLMPQYGQLQSSSNPAVMTAMTDSNLKRSYDAISSSSGVGGERNVNQFTGDGNFPDTYGMSSPQFVDPNHLHIMEDDDDEDDFDEAEAPTETSSGVMTPKERRRERNKVLARKTRMKKKAELETLRNQVQQLSTENRELKMARFVLTLELLGNHHVPRNIRQRIQGQDSSESTVSSIQSVFNDNAMKAVAGLLSKSQRSFCITNHDLPDQPIIYASPLFLELTGYSAEEAVGRNCRFLQGRETNREDVTRIRETIKAGEICNVALLNYRKNGSKFWNSIHLSPMKAATGEVLLYVGIQEEITPEKAAKINSRTEDIKNMLLDALSSSAGTDRASEVSFGSEDCLSLSTADGTNATLGGGAYSI